MAKAYLLTEADRNEIRKLIAEERRRYGGTAQRPHLEGEDYQTPEVYVAKTPEDGIPAATFDGVDFYPGYADCEIYRVLLDDGEPYLSPLSNLSKRVHNLALEEAGTGAGESGAVGGDVWLTVLRDKFGSWFIAGSGGGGSSGGEEDAGKVLVKNETGTMRSKYDVVELLEPVVTPAEDLVDFKEGRPFFIAVKPTGESEPAKANSIYGVLLQDLEDSSGVGTGTGTSEGGDDVGLAVVSGVVQVQIDVTDAAHKTAEVLAGSYNLKSSASGSAKIVWKPSGTGVKWCIVRLPEGGTGGGGENAGILQVTDTTPSKNGDGTQDCFLVDGSGGGGSGSTVAAKMYNRNTSVAALPVGFYYGVLLVPGPTLTSDVPVYAVAYRTCS